MPYLIQKNPDGSTLKQWDLRDKPLTVGRGDEVDAKIDDQEISRKHCVISPKGGSYVLEDMDSRNGTWVNGKRVSGERQLNPNDKIRIGKTDFVFVEGLVTVVGQLEKEPKGLGTYIREISKKDKV